MTTRTRAKTLIGLALLLPNLYALLVVWAFTIGPSATGVVQECSGRTQGGCYATWTADGGAAGDGKVAGTGAGDRGEAVQLRIGPLGAYLDTPETLWVRVAVVGAMDLALATGLTIGRRRIGRAQSAGRGLVQAAGAWRVLELTGTRAIDQNGSLSAELRPTGPQNSEVVDSTGRRILHLDQSDPGYGETTLVVLDPVGRPVGRIDGHHRVGPIAGYAFTSAASGLLAMSRSTGSIVEIHPPTGPPLAVLGSAHGSSLFLRVERAVDPTIMLLLTGFLFDFERLSSTRLLAQTTIVTGRGWAD